LKLIEVEILGDGPESQGHDPFDRILVAQDQIENLVLVSGGAGRAISRHGGVAPTASSATRRQFWPPLWHVYTHCVDRGRVGMRTTKIFKSGNSQAVRLPKDLRFNVREVEILRRGGEIVLRKRPRTAVDLYRALAAIRLPEDFPDTIGDVSAEVPPRL
jgi:antitoxin VapB